MSFIATQTHTQRTYKHPISDIYPTLSKPPSAKKKRSHTSTQTHNRTDSAETRAPDHPQTTRPHQTVDSQRDCCCVASSSTRSGACRRDFTRFRRRRQTIAHTPSTQTHRTLSRPLHPKKRIEKHRENPTMPRNVVASRCASSSHVFAVRVCVCVYLAADMNGSANIDAHTRGRTVTISGTPTRVRTGANSSVFIASPSAASAVWRRRANGRTITSHRHRDTDTDGKQS